MDWMARVFFSLAMMEMMEMGGEIPASVGNGEEQGHFNFVVSCSRLQWML